MMLSAPFRILLVAAVAIVGLVGLVVGETLARAAGTEVTLRMEAVDPRSILSGHFVVVSLQETLPPGQGCPGGVQDAPTVMLPFASDNAVPDRRTTWIALAPRGPAYSVVGAAGSRRAAAGYGKVVVRGRAFCRTVLDISPRSGAPQPGAPAGQTVSVTLDLGVDRFYVSQAEGRAIDALLARPAVAGAEGPVQAIVSVGLDGRARMKGLRVEGRRIEPSLF